jgi:hypothetical protein
MKQDGSTAIETFASTATASTPVSVELGITYNGAHLGGISAKTDAAGTTATIVYDLVGPPLVTHVP